jgi:hypothetical protein
VPWQAISTSSTEPFPSSSDPPCWPLGSAPSARSLAGSNPCPRHDSVAPRGCHHSKMFVSASAPLLRSCALAPAPKYSVMLPNPRVPQGKRRTERRLNALPSRPEDESRASTTIPTCQAALVADLLRPGWLSLPRCHVIPLPLRATAAAGLSPAGLQPCRLLIWRSVRLSRLAGQQRLFASGPRRTPLSNTPS